MEYRTRRNRFEDWGEWAELPPSLIFSEWYMPALFEFRESTRKPGMVGAWVAENGDVIYACMRCNEVYVVDYESRNSPFWDVLNGNAVLLLLGHYMSVHGAGMVFPSISSAGDNDAKGGENNGG